MTFICNILLIPLSSGARSPSSVLRDSTHFLRCHTPKNIILQSQLMDNLAEYGILGWLQFTSPQDSEGTAPLSDDCLSRVTCKFSLAAFRFLSGCLRFWNVTMLCVDIHFFTIHFWRLIGLFQPRNS